MEEKRILTITKTDGSKEQVEEVISFEFNDTKKRYVVYTKNEKDENGNVTIYVTRIVSDENGNRFLGVENDDEWNRIKAALRALIKKEY
ncbi:MAG TPA: DUF1292 domain-containing protein [Bacilli bacterium]|nr:DUF1292 domain-containing protein [Mycoplasmatota bacterium]MDY4237065.1 DUF1292 domain-containing protein [Bacilli bacterium]CDA23293.1 putative uncharacterized protein [Mycoplasma sp. CAG:611]HJJ08366.1 DUF1292 domain-containing protein [Bacilli bacterium]